MPTEGILTRSSRYPAKETMDRLAAAVAKHGMTVVARVDHAGAAAKVGLELMPTELLVFGNPRAGTPLMQASQLIGIDLPLRALVWQDEAGKVWVATVDPSALAIRHGIAATTGKTIEQMTAALDAVVGEATT